MSTAPRSNPFSSVFAKITLMVTLCGFIFGGLMVALSDNASQTRAAEETRAHAASVTPLIARQVIGALRFDKADQAESVLTDILSDSNGEGIGMALVNAEGAPFVTVGAKTDALLSVARKAIQTGAEARSEDGFTYAMPLMAGAQQNVIGALVSAWSPEPAIVAARADMLKTLGITAGTFVLCIIGVAWAIYAVIARPLNRVNSAMSQVAVGHYETEIPATHRRDEIGAIARSLDTFREGLAASEEANRTAILRGAALEAGSVAVMITDNDNRITFLNPAMTALFRKNLAALRKFRADFDPDNLLGQRADQIIPQGKQAVSSRDQGQKGAMRLEQRLDGAYLVVSINTIHDPMGKKIGHVAEWRDVTRAQHDEAVVSAIDLSQARAEVSTDGRLQSANDRFMAMMGDGADRLVGTDVRPLISMTDGSPVFDSLAKGKPLTGKMAFTRPAGGQALVLGAFSPVLDSQGQPQQFVLLGTDVTEAEDAVARATEERARTEAAQQKVVDALRGALRALSDGDLTATIDARFQPEYEELRNDYNAALSNLRTAMQEVLENASTIRNESGEIASAAEDLSRRTEQQAATLEETAAALNELTESVRSAAEVAAQANEMVAKAKANAETSGNVVREAIHAMGEIEKSSGNISRITSVIDEIAFQTNLLALNAGVEAARAGEAGRGFAVVASEVRALAQRSSEAAREIAGLISASNDQVKRGVGLVGQAGEALSGIESSVGEVYTFVSEIAVSAREQSSGLAEINTAVTQLDQVTQQNAAMFEETTAASHALTREAESLNTTTARFRISGQAAPGRAPVATAAAKPAPAPARPAPAAKPRPAPAKAAQAAPMSKPAPKPASKPAAKSAAPPAATGGARRATALAVKPETDDSDWEDF
ncbi:methyl-accepting chemotaxis protein [Phaeovulum vinaykumarii]|uniref:Methyl-accepting chemotaxis protein n=1 Tax=Phaeovulum vinaykumarii TaxID=407234 RepID=A0A1N7JMK0_9RHOB|nr:methyl-accepting chemotaxis protein [Phaeovulum vinaykumarii]SIS50530.1 methyl-accepting chemotaxis protein [Phaeovulum vinaykumarii]SOB90306.1 methyl-accepting chemotaxis protein [Phaeovulum vinaykumarii]